MNSSVEIELIVAIKEGVCMLKKNIKLKMLGSNEIY